ncbi:MAG: MFS transporter [Burkholderiales bacterium]|nr:MFS transporter [Burkholderiales bacterium]
MNNNAWRTPAVVLVAGSLILVLSMGVRATSGIFLQPMTMAHGWSREAYSFAIAVQNLAWGLGSPFFGAIADKYGAGRTVAVAAVLYALGLGWMAYAPDVLQLSLSAGVITGLGISGTSVGIILAVMARAVAPEKRSLALGLGSAASSLGQFLMLPVGQGLIDGVGWQMALVAHALLAALIVPLAAGVGGKAAGAAIQGAQSLGAALREASRDGSFHLLFWGYFVCGFQVVFIALHLPPYVVDKGLPANVGGIALALVGLFNIAGSLGAGWLGGRFAKKYLLSFIYAARSVVIVLFLLAPLTPLSVYLFAAAMGLLWLSTVPLTNGLVGFRYGVKYMAMLAGIVFLGHQLGSFLGAWLGGVIFDRTGSYDVAWALMIAAGVYAAIVHLPIREAPIAHKPVPA